MNRFDTADSYGTGALTGRSEELLGSFQSKPTNKNIKANFCTKLAPYPWRIGSESFRKAHEESNKRLQRNVDVVQLHWPPFLGWQEASYLQAMNGMVQSNTAKQIGVSNYGPKSLKKVSSYMRSLGQNVYTNQVLSAVISQL